MLTWRFLYMSLKLEKKSNVNWAEHEIFTTEIIFPNT